MSTTYDLGRFRLDRALVVFDIEATGPDIYVDRIVEIAMVRLNPSGTSSEFRVLVNPGVPIPAEAAEIHGITNDQVAREPSFEDVAPDILGMMENADLGGYNLLRFDIPMLRAEFDRIKRPLSLEGVRIIDVQRIFHQQERRTLGAAYEFYCGKTLVDAHGALPDARATLEVLLAQMVHYPSLPGSLPDLEAELNKPDYQFVDLERRFRWRDHEPSFNFGSQRGKSLREVAMHNPDYLDQLLHADLPPKAKSLIRDALRGNIPRRETPPVTPPSGASTAPAGGSAVGLSRIEDRPTPTPTVRPSEAAPGGDVYERSMALHETTHGKVEIHTRMRLETQEDLSLAYTPGVARPCEVIAKDAGRAWDLTWKGRSVAVVSDGSAVLGLGDIGPLAALPVMEGKSVLFREFGGVDAVPVVLDAREPDDVIHVVKSIAPSFGGINLEDISAPRCFEIEDRLQDIGIPVLHDDQHGTAIVLMAAMRNAVKWLGLDFADLAVVISGAGAAGRAISRLLTCQDTSDSCKPVGRIRVCDSRGILRPGREKMDPVKEELAQLTNPDGQGGSLHDALVGANVFIGVSRGNLLNGDDIRRMAAKPIVLAMANPTPEIMPEEARAAGAAIVGTGRSDYPNQVNNVLAFPGLFRGALEAKATRFNAAMKLAAVDAIAGAVGELRPDHIIPAALDRSVAGRVAVAVAQAARDSGLCH